MGRIKYIPLFLLFIFSLPVFTESVEISDLLHETGSSLQWEPYRRIGIIVRGNNKIVFKPGFKWMILNYSQKISVENIFEKEDGSINFSAADADSVRELLKSPVIAADDLFVSTIIIDPGHGGRDSGASRQYDIDGKSVTLKEKEVVLKVSQQLFTILKQTYPDKEIIITRSDDTYLQLEERSNIANKYLTQRNNEVLIFVSVHANASMNSAASGFEVWHLPPDYRRNLADQIDKDVIVEGSESDILPILITMLEEELSIESILLAQKILGEMANKIGDVSLNRGLKEESWAVVRNSMMSSVLIEIGFVSNKSEALHLMDNGYLMKIANGIYNGIGSFISYIESSSTE